MEYCSLVPTNALQKVYSDYTIVQLGLYLFTFKALQQGRCPGIRNLLNGTSQVYQTRHKTGLKLLIFIVVVVVVIVVVIVLVAVIPTLKLMTYSYY